MHIQVMRLGLDKSKLNLMAALFVLSLLTRIMMSPMHLDEPTTPFDFYAYVGGGQCFMQVFSGQTGCLKSLDVDFQNRYGPMFNLIMASVMLFFGPGYYLLKFPSIFADSLIPPLLVMMTWDDYNIQNKFFAPMFYALSALTLILSGFWGNDDSLFILPTLFSAFLLMRGYHVLSAISLAFACLFKVTPAIIMIPLAFHIYKKIGVSTALFYGLVFTLSFSMSYLPYVYVAGDAAFIPFTAPLKWGVDGLSFQNLIRMSYALPYHIIYPDMPTSFSSNDPNDPFNYWGETSFAKILRLISLPSTLMGLTFYLFYIFKRPYSMKPQNLYLNITLILMFFLFFSKTIYSPYYLWFLPFLLLSIPTDSIKLKFSQDFFIGIALTAYSLLAYGLFYKISEPMFQSHRFFLLMGAIAAFFGTYKVAKSLGTKMFFELSLLTFIFYIDIIVSARLPLLLLTSLTFIPNHFLQPLAFYGMYYVTTVLNIYAFLWIFNSLRKMNSKK